MAPVYIIEEEDRKMKTIVIVREEEYFKFQENYSRII